MKERKNLPEAELDIMLVIWYEEKKEGERRPVFWRSWRGL